MKELLLLPRPARIKNLNGKHTLRKDRLIAVQNIPLKHALFMGNRLRSAIKEKTGVDYGIVRYSSLKDSIGIRIISDPGLKIPCQEYKLSITPKIIEIKSRDETGAFYGVCTLIQIIERCGKNLPCLKIEDHPDFETRGVMLDISRAKVPKMETLFDIVDQLSSWKINHIELYTEHTFAYQSHRIVWEKSSPMTGQEIMELDAYCRERHIDLVPNQNSFGHFQRWLKHKKYANLGEEPGGNTLCPTDKGAVKLISELYDELLPHFSSGLFNVGCDETQLGRGRSRAACKKKGEGRVYLEYLLSIYRLVKERGRKMMFWGDIIVRHPELVRELPKDIIALSWDYEANAPFDKQGKLFSASEIPFYVCPGTSSWLSIAGRSDNCMGNLLNAAENGRKHGAIGFLNTDWGDFGHWQYLPISYLGFAYGAGVSWCTKANRDMPVAQTLSLRAFNDPTGHIGKLAYELGKAGDVTGLYIPNDSPLFDLIQFYPLQDPKIINGMKPNGLDRAMQQIDRAMSHLAGVKIAREDAGLIENEFLNTATLLRHACHRGEVTRKLSNGVKKRELREELRMLRESIKTVMAEHRKLWLARNRPGGLDESLAFMQRVLREYK